MPVLSAEVSRALAVFIAKMGLGQESARALVEQYGPTGSASDLPDWLTEHSDDERSLAPDFDTTALRVRGIAGSR